MYDEYDLINCVPEIRKMLDWAPELKVKIMVCLDFALKSVVEPQPKKLDPFP